MTPNLDERLSSWRKAAGIVTRPVKAEQATDWVATHHRQQLERSGLLALENLAAHDQFCKEIEAYVKRGASERSEEHHQRVTDYAGYLLRMYENTSANALERAIFNVLQDLPHEVIRTVQAEPRRQLPRRSLLDRFLNR
jgi:hypothetical protein